MAYLSDAVLRSFGFKALGQNVKISEKASIYDCDRIEIGDFSRIDDFCVVSGTVSIGRYNHITPMCIVAGGVSGITMGDFCTLAYNVKVFSQSDDYGGQTLTNSLIPKRFKNETLSPVKLNRHVIIGSGSSILPGVDIAEGCAVGAMSLVRESTRPWGIYVGIPAKRIKERSRDLLELELEFLDQQSGN